MCACEEIILQTVPHSLVVISPALNMASLFRLELLTLSPLNATLAALTFEIYDDLERRRLETVWSGL